MCMGVYILCDILKKENELSRSFDVIKLQFWYGTKDFYMSCIGHLM
jgi:hypothetical protein